MLGNPRIYANPNRNIGDDGMNYIYPVWLFFTAFFLYFAYINWRQASADIRPFTFRQRGQDPDEDPEAEVSEANVRFAHDFNAYLDIVNTSNIKRHRAAAVGYFIAGLLSLGSVFMLLFS
jgi:hypothetical protein